MKLEILEENLRELLEGLDDDSAVTVWNEYCRTCQCYDDEIYPMYMFDEMHENLNPSELVNLVTYGHHFSTCDRWFCYNGYGNLESFDWITDDARCPFCIGDLVKYLVRTGDGLGVDALQEFLDDHLDEDEDDEDEAEDGEEEEE